jgi:hypothetical protein
MQSADKPKVLLVVGNLEGPTLLRWKDWADFNGYEFQHKTLEEVGQQGVKNCLVILDEWGLNDSPLPPLTKGEQLIIDEVYLGPPREAVEMLIRSRPEPIHPEILGPTRRSKGDRHRNRRHRWS